jgi:predicted nucleotidyltransferase
MVELPRHIARMAEDLAAVPGAVAVVLGGSRALGVAREDSDWDLGVYYRSTQRQLDPQNVRALGYQGTVSELGEWGPLVNGGGWLSVEGGPVDVLFRDLDAVERWWSQAERGEFDVLLQPGTIVGAPTYLPVGELAICQVVHGQLNRPGSYPEELAERAPQIWRGKAGAALLFARGYAGLGDVVNCVGMLSQAILCEAHARTAETKHWALNEKRLIAEADLEKTHMLLSRVENSTESLASVIQAVEEILGTRSATKG